MVKNLNWFKNAKMSSKIIFGYTGLILLLITISIYSVVQLNMSVTDFTRYRGLARETNLSGGLQANMLMVRMNVKDFIITSSEKDLQQYKDYWEKVSVFLEEARQTITDPKRSKRIEQVTKDLNRYQESFKTVVDLDRKRRKLITETDSIGPVIEKALTRILTTARRDGDMTAAYYSSLATRNALLARMYRSQFLIKNENSHVKRVDKEFREMEKNLKILDRELQNRERRRLLKEAILEKEKYEKGFKQLVQIVLNRNNIITGTLDQLGPVIADEVEKVKQSVKGVQDELGPKVQAETRQARMIIIVVSVLATMIGVFLSFIVIRSVLSQLGADPGIIVEIVHRVSGGDFTYDFKKNGNKLTGVYENIKLMCDKLRKTFSNITEVVETLASSSTELSSISNQLATGSEQMSGKSNGVAAAAEEMSANMNSVAAAVEQASANANSVAQSTKEMNSSILELTENADSANVITTSAVKQAEDISKRVEELGDSATEVGTVTETITAISEKTNLLALNATIEAARAGEAGKGFAVVATEIKELANGTANSTKEIKTKIDAIQESTTSAVTEIREITGVIKNVNDIVTRIAQTTKGQVSITEEISSNISQISDGIDETSGNINQSSTVSAEIAADISEVNMAASDITNSSGQVSESADDLNTLSSRLKKMVNEFKI